jgi:hypothetical protein
MIEYVVGKFDDIALGTAIAMQAGRRTIAVFRLGNEFFAVTNACPHKCGSLCDGEIIVEEMRNFATRPTFSAIPRTGRTRPWIRPIGWSRTPIAFPSKCRESCSAAMRANCTRGFNAAATTAGRTIGRNKVQSWRRLYGK